MNQQSITHGLIAACCLTLLLAGQVVADEQAEQAATIDSLIESVVNEMSAKQDEAVKPVGCCDSGGDSCCGGGAGCCGNSAGCCSSNCCCEAVCCPKKVTEEVKKHCWLVKPELVCIPGFRFECNWRKSKCCKSGCCNGGCDCGDSCYDDSCCGCNKCACKDPGKPTCGRVRCIHVLEKHEYTCDECGYEWEVKCVRSGRGKSCCGQGGCCCPSCGCASKDATNDLESDIELTSATESKPASDKKTSLSSRLKSWLK